MSIYKSLQEDDLVDASVEELDSISPGSNPYRYPEWSGISVPKGWEVMYEVSSPGALEELILVNHFTGQRLKIGFTPKYPQVADIIKTDKHRDIRHVSGSIYMPDVQGDGTIRWEPCDDIDVSDMLDDLYTLWWGQEGMHFVRVKLFMDTERFPAAFLNATLDERFDGNRLYPGDVEHLKQKLAKYEPGPAPATAKNVKAKPFGLNE